MNLVRQLKKIYRWLPFFLLLLLPLIIFRFKTVQRVLTRAFYTKAAITVNVKETPPNWYNNWQCFGQGGEEPGVNMLQSVVSPLRSLNPRYIRLDHIFDDDYYGVVTATGQYDFTRLDQTVDSIVQTGAKPLLVLSYMPSFMAASKISTPDNWQKWEQLVTTTIEHYSGFNQKNIQNVYYEVWNEPDLDSFGGFKYYGQKSYLDLYLHSTRAINNIHWANSFKIGGPATTSLYENWVRALLDYSQSNNLPLGFISFHQYSPYPEEYLKNMTNLKSILAYYPQYQNLDILLTEWGPDSAKNPVYNTVTAAAFSLATISEVNQQVSLACAFEIKDGPQTNSWGLIGHDSRQLKLKPRYQAFSWLAELTEPMGLNGDGTFVTGLAGKNDDRYLLLLTNYDPAGSHQELVPVRFINLKPGKYTLTKQFLGQDPIREEINLESSVYSADWYLPANSVLKLDLVPYSDTGSVYP